MDVDEIKARQIPFVYVSPPVCEYIFSASGETEIFLNDRTPTVWDAGTTITWNGAFYRIQWNTYPGALCYSLYKLVDELDPFSAYTLVAECITDTFFDTTDPGVYAPTAIDPDGETPLPTDGGTPTPPVDPCEGVPAPVVSGHEEWVCSELPTTIDVTPHVGDATEITEAACTVPGAIVSIAGMNITYTPPPGGYAGTGIVSYTVANACASSDNAFTTTARIMGVLTPPVTALIARPSQQLDVNVKDYMTFLNQDQEDNNDITVDVANIFDLGGSVVFGGGPVVEYTPNSNDFGYGELYVEAVNQCTDRVSDSIPILVLEEDPTCPVVNDWGTPWAYNLISAGCAGGNSDWWGMRNQSYLYVYNPPGCAFVREASLTKPISYPVAPPPGCSITMVWSKTAGSRITVGGALWDASQNFGVASSGTLTKVWNPPSFGLSYTMQIRCNNTPDECWAYMYWGTKP